MADVVSVSLSSSSPLPDHSVPASVPPDVNKILVIGGPQVGKKHIVRRLLNSPSLSPTLLSVPTSPSLPSSPPPSSVPVHAVYYPISTRYYTATLHLHILNNSAIPPFSPSSLSSLLSSPLLSGLQGLLLVYDASELQSLRDVQRWGAVAQQMGDDDSGVMLMVGVEREEGKGQTLIWDEARDWSIDHGMEHIRLPYDPQLTAGGSVVPQKAEDEGEGDEDEGLRRIAGAFEANRWQHMVMKDRAAAARGRLDRSDDDEPLSIDARLAQEEEKEEAELEAHLQAEEEEEMRRAEERARVTAALEEEIAAQRDGEAAQRDDGKTEDEIAREDEQMERHLTSFEAMFERMRRIRQDALSAKAGGDDDGSAAARGTGLSDTERRRRAEDAIMAMLSQMGLGEDDDDEEEEI